MKNREIRELMKNAAVTPGFGGTDAEVLENGRQTLLSSLDSKATSKPVYTIKEYMEFASSYIFDVVAKPMAVGVSSLVLALGGWVVAVNASTDTVPGDTLYPVKIATERVQLTFATSTEKRAKLRIDFAGRRLTEVENISLSDRDGKEIRMQDALENFRREMEIVNSNIQSMSDSNLQAAADLADLVSRKTDEYEIVIRDSVAGSDELTESQDGVLAAQKEVRSTNHRAMGILVDNQEVTLAPRNSEQLEKMFRNDLEGVRGRFSVVESRLQTIQTVLTDTEEFNADFVSENKNLSFDIRKQMIDMEPALADARSFLAAGGFRKTFEIMAGIKTAMVEIDGSLAQLEINITLAMRDIESATSTDDEAEGQQEGDLAF